jgi:hypothetical protein
MHNHIHTQHLPGLRKQEGQSKLAKLVGIFEEHRLRKLQQKNEAKSERERLAAEIREREFGAVAETMLNVDHNL